MPEGLRGAVDDAATALIFLTRIPVPWHVADVAARLQRASPWFPAVGALVGGLGALVAWGGMTAWGPVAGALLAVATTAAVTGAFHEDGLADTFDGLGGASGREAALAIMRDSRLGTFGALALGLVTALRVAALAGLAGAAPMTLIGAHALARYSSLPLIRVLPYARIEGGMAQPFAGGISGRGLTAATVATAALTVLLWPGAALVVWAAAAAVVVIAGAWARARLGGITGDVLGAANQLVETVTYLVLAWAWAS